MNENGLLGRSGERMAAEYLATQGLALIDVNWHAGRIGELDLIMQQDDEIVFVEVKTRRGQPAAETIDERKLGRLRQLAGTWLAAQSSWFEHRIDMVGVEIGLTGCQIHWWQGIDR